MPTAVDVFSKLRDKLGEEEARALVEFVQESVEKPQIIQIEPQMGSHRLTQIRTDGGLGWSGTGEDGGLGRKSWGFSLKEVIIDVNYEGNLRR